MKTCVQIRACICLDFVLKTIRKTINISVYIHNTKNPILRESFLDGIYYEDFCKYTDAVIEVINVSL